MVVLSDVYTYTEDFDCHPARLKIFDIWSVRECVDAGMWFCSIMYLGFKTSFLPVDFSNSPLDSLNLWGMEFWEYRGLLFECGCLLFDLLFDWVTRGPNRDRARYC